MRAGKIAPPHWGFGMSFLLALLILSACDNSNGPAPQPTAPPATVVSKLGSSSTPLAGPSNTLPMVGPMVGELAPDFALNTYEGKRVRLSDTVKQHKATLIVFWATWCGDCIQEMPLLDQAYKQFSKGGFELLGVNMAEPADQIGPDVHSVSYSTLLDPNGVASGAYWVTALPSAFMIGADGVVKYHYYGPFNTVDFPEQLKGLGVNVSQ